jgi:hypothetical protein
MIRCFVCKQLIREQNIQTRVRPISHTSGFMLGAHLGWASYTTEAPVPICPACDEQLPPPRQPSRLWGVVQLLIIAWLSCYLVFSQGMITYMAVMELAKNKAWISLAIVGVVVSWRGATIARRLCRRAEKGMNLPRPNKTLRLH